MMNRGSFALLVALAAMSLPGAAFAQQVASSADSRCIQTINGSTRKVALAAGKELRACADDRAGGLLGAQTIAQCVSSSSTVTGAVTKALLQADGACNGAPPSFGPPSIS